MAEDVAIALGGPATGVVTGSAVVVDGGVTAAGGQSSFWTD